MDFMGALSGLPQFLIEELSEGSSAAASALSAGLNYQSQANNQQNTFDINQRNLNAQADLQLNGQNFTSQQNALNRTFQNSQLQQNIQANQQLQNSRFSNLESLQNTRLQAQQSMQTSNNISNFARGALNFGGGLLSSGLQFAANNQLASLQRQNFDYMTGKASDAFSNAGLPSWLAFQNNPQMMNQLPKTAQVYSGQNMMVSSLPGNPMSQAWTGSQSQAAFGFGDLPLASN